MIDARGRASVAVRKPLVEENSSDGVRGGPLEVLLRVEAALRVARVEGARQLAPLFTQDAVETRLVEAVRAQRLYEELPVRLVRVAVRFRENICKIPQVGYTATPTL